MTAAAVTLRAGLRGGGSWIALAATGSVLAFAVSNAPFDALAFPHAPYAFLLIVALVGVARHEDETPSHQSG